MISILQHHFFCVSYGDFLPLFIPYMLPAGYLGKHQQSYFITAVDEGL
jgi:hypothetical protein